MCNHSCKHYLLCLPISKARKMEKSGLVKCVYLRSTSPGGSVCIVEKYPRNRRTQTGKYCFPPRQKCPKVGQHNAVMVCKCNLHLDGKKHISCQSFGDEGAGKVAIAIKDREKL